MEDVEKRGERVPGIYDGFSRNWKAKYPPLFIHTLICTDSSRIPHCEILWMSLHDGVSVRESNWSS